jgi:protein TonB
VKKYRYWFSFLATTLLYLLSYLLLLSFLKPLSFATQTNPKEQTMVLSLSSFEAPTPSIEPPKEITEPEQTPPKEPLPTPQEPPKPKEVEVKKRPFVEKEVEKLPTPVLKPTPKPHLDPVKRKIQRVKPSKVKHHKVKQKPHKKHHKKGKHTPKKAFKQGVAKPYATPAKRSAFLAKLKARIAHHRHYPLFAKRRGVQGRIEIWFKLHPNGTISHIRLKGKKIFYRATRKALKESFPMRLKKVPFVLPATLHLWLNYRLTEN